MTPPPTPSSSTIPARAATIDDLRTKLCWICREEETAGESHPSNQPWVHACNCVLVAHESCLLTWIAQAQSDSSRAATALQCPQCKAKYVIRSHKPPILRALNYARHQVGVYARWGSIIVVASGVVLCTSAYGGLALRAFLGAETFHYHYGSTVRELGWHAMEFSVVPFVLFAARTDILDEALLLIPLLVIPTSAYSAGTDALHFGITQTLTDFYPPTPSITMLLLPVIRTLYRTALNRFSNWVLRRPNRRRPSILDEGVTLRLERGGEEPDIREELANEDGAQPQVVVVTERSIARLFFGSLMVPFISNGMGTLLNSAAHFSPLLRTILGIHSQPTIPKIPSILFTPLQIQPLFRPFHSMDPQWWRNAIGYSFFVLITDAGDLFHRWLGMREIRSRRVLGRSFKGIDPKELDLIVPL